MREDLANPLATEPIPDYYRNSVAARELESPEAILLENLRNDLLFAPVGPAITDNLYRVARSIGDFDIYEADDSGEVVTIFDATRYEATPQDFLASVEEMGEHTAGYHNSAESTFAVAHDYLNQESKVIAERIEANGVELKNKSDAYLVSFLHVGAHEAGHAALSGISRYYNVGAEITDQFAATKMYLRDHPEDGMTGSWVTDVWIHEERFAEGYAMVVVDKALKVLGYTDEEIQVIREQVAIYSDAQRAEQGKSQIDIIDELGHFTKPTDLLGDEAYLGELGYPIPLSKSKVVEELAAISRVFSSVWGKNLHMASLDWEEAVRDKQSPEVRTYIDNLKQQRKEYLEKNEAESAKAAKKQHLGGQILRSMAIRPKRKNRSIRQ